MGGYGSVGGTRIRSQFHPDALRGRGTSNPPVNKIIDVTRPSGRTVELTSADFAAFAGPLLLELRTHGQIAEF